MKNPNGYGCIKLLSGSRLHRGQLRHFLQLQILDV